MSKTTRGENWAEIVGMPDDWDKNNIQNLIKAFESVIFDLPVSDNDEDGTIRVSGRQWIINEVEDAKKQHGLDIPMTKDQQYGLKSKDSDMRILTAIPQPLWEKIREAYPTIFRDKKQYMWFVKNFPQFRLVSKI